MELRSPGPHGSSPFKVGEWLAVPDSGELTHLPSGRVERLEPRVMELLCYLARTPGELVSKRELLESVWQGTFVTDDVVRQTLAGLRRGLGDDARSPTYVETLPRRGYRLIAPVAPAEPTAGEAAAAPAAVHPGPEPTPAPRRTSHARWWRVAAASLVVAGVLALVTSTGLTGLVDGGAERPAGPSSGLAGSRTDPERVVIGRFDNRTGDPQLDHLATAFRIGIEESPRLTVLPPQAVREGLERMERNQDAPIDRALGVELCRREGVRALVLAGLGLVDDTYVLGAEVIDAATGEVTFAAHESTRDRSRLIRSLDDLVAAVRVGLGEAAGRLRSLPRLEAVTTDSLDALEAYSKSLALANDVRSSSEDVIVLLEHAVAVDPDFATARARLAVTYAYSGRQYPEVWRTLKAALAHSDRMTRYERLYAQAWAATLEGRRDEALRLWQLMALLFPDRRIGETNVARMHWTFDNSFEAAWAAFERIPTAAADFDRANWLVLGSWLALAAERDDAGRWIETRVAEGPESADLVSLLGAAGEHEQAEAMLERVVRDVNPRHNRVLSVYTARLALDQGELRRALAASGALHVPALEPIRTFEWRVQRIPAHAALGDRAGARREIAAALELAGVLASQVTDAPPNPSFAIGVAVLGKLAAVQGETAAARRAQALLRGLRVRMPANAPLEAYAQMLEAEIAAAEGSPAEALATLDRPPWVDSFQEHESRARLLAALGRNEEAAAEYRWMIDHRGRILMECLFSLQCYEMELNTLDWHRAHVRLAELLEAAGRHAEAEQLYEAVARRWLGGDAGIPELELARSRAGEPQGLTETRS